jgi:hypothetical protein
MAIDTTATPLGANPSTDQRPATAPRQGIVNVLNARRYRRQAVCTCGYTGKRRLWRCIAVVDALNHAGSCGCAPAARLAAPVQRGQHGCAQHPTGGGRHARSGADAPTTRRVSTANDDDGY